MGGMDMGFVNEPSMCGEKTTCPQWMAGEQLYNCENFTKTLRNHRRRGQDPPYRSLHSSSRRERGPFSRRSPGAAAGE